MRVETMTSTFCLSDMIVYFPNFPSSPPRAYLSWVRNQHQLAVSSLSTSPKAIGKMLLLASLPVAARICCPVVSFTKHPSRPRINKANHHIATLCINLINQKKNTNYHSLPINGRHPFKNPSLDPFRHINNPWNLGFGLGCSSKLFVVTMHRLPGFVSITACK